MFYKYLVSFICGFLFALGLSISGMTQPHKVIGFLDVFSSWDVSLMFVMVGAILVYSVSFIFVKRKKSPVLGTRFHLPMSSALDFKLFLGAVLFGVGWALAGLCPGPALVSLVSGSVQVYYFVIAMVVGAAIPEVLNKVSQA